MGRVVAIPTDALYALAADPLSLRAVRRIYEAKGFTLDLRGTKLVYDAAKQTLTCKNVTAPLKPRNGMIFLRILVDRGSVEVFAGESTVAMSVAAIPDEKNNKLELTPQGGEVTVRVATVHRMKSAWGK